MLFRAVISIAEWKCPPFAASFKVNNWRKTGRLFIVKRPQEMPCICYQC